MTVTIEHVLGIEPRNIAGTNSGVSDLDLDHWWTYLFYQNAIDSHANMATLDKNVKIINESGRKLEVSSFNLDYESLSKVRIVDAAMRCNYLFSGETWLLIVRKDLSIPTMGHNWTPPFVTRGARVDAR